MTAFRGLCALIFITVFSYTAVVVATHGLAAFPSTYFGDIARMGWAGQFNIDFACFLLLAALWIATRHRFSPLGLGLALFTFVGGAPFLSVYLIIASVRAGGKLEPLLLGDYRD